MHNYNETDTHQLIVEHQHRLQLYDVAKSRADSSRTHSEYERKCHLNGLFTHHVLTQLNDVKHELASHGYGCLIESKTEQIEHDNVVIDVIYEVAFKFDGSLQSDLAATSDDSQLVFFTQSGSHFIACRYKTSQLTSQVQWLYFADEVQSEPCCEHAQAVAEYHHSEPSYSELASLVDDFISLVFIQKRANLTRV
ncbi:hypothetical protein ACSLBF_19400 (plasmid) [Pseudoalteromonas sp. T1lg65]|uniref:hypothetical protein n=1 Tax=Pseudoalteromonas sp. T1lg65 TaxID=2077101 RepID=UPI003F7ADF49